MNFSSLNPITYIRNYIRKRKQRKLIAHYFREFTQEQLNEIFYSPKPKPKLTEAQKADIKRRFGFTHE